MNSNSLNSGGQTDVGRGVTSLWIRSIITGRPMRLHEARTNSTNPGNRDVVSKKNALSLDSRAHQRRRGALRSEV